MITKQLLFFSLLFYLIPLIAAGEEPADKKNLGISDAYLLGYESKVLPDSRLSAEKYNEARRTAGINDTVVVVITDRQALIEKALCIKANSNCSAQAINLYLNGKKIAERDPKDGSLGRAQNTVEFDLKYDSNRADLKSNWAALLGSPPLFSGGFFKRPVQLALGLDTGPIFDLNDGRFMLRRIDMAKFWICIGLLVVLVIIVWNSQGIKRKLREALTDIGPPPPVPDFKPWSLARCQMAFWFVLVAVSFLSIWVVTGALDTITGSVLALIGIGSGAALGSAMIDVSADLQTKMANLREKEKKLAADISDIDAKIKPLGAGAPSYLTDLKSNIEANVASIQQQLVRSSNSLSQGFWNDVLNDHEGGAGFHRIQMVVWTLILGGIFIYSVWKTLSMPEFSETLLALQGLSAGTYLGFKIPDKKP